MTTTGLSLYADMVLLCPGSAALLQVQHLQTPLSSLSLPMYLFVVQGAALFGL